MDIFLNQWIEFYLNNMINLRPLISTQYVMLYPQNGDRILATDTVTSLHLMYKRTQRSAKAKREVQEEASTGLEALLKIVGLEVTIEGIRTVERSESWR